MDERRRGAEPRAGRHQPPQRAAARCASAWPPTITAATWSTTCSPPSRSPRPSASPTCNRCELYLVGADAEALREAARRAAGRAVRARPRAGSSRCSTSARAPRRPSTCSRSPRGSTRSSPARPRSWPRSATPTRARFEWGATGPVSNRLFHVALEAGKRVRHETAIGSGGASVASVAAEVAAERLGGLAGVSVLVVGAGRVAELVAANLTARGAGPLRGRQPRPRPRGRAGRPLRRHRDRLRRAWRRRSTRPTSSSARPPRPGTSSTPATCAPGRPRLLIDLAVPRDIDPAAAAVDGTTVVDLDGLEAAVGADDRAAPGRERPGAGDRGRAGGRVPRLDGGASGRARDHARCATTPSASAPPSCGGWSRAGTRSRPPTASAWTRSRAAMLNKLLHEPTVRLKQLAAADQSAPYAEAVTELFGLAAHPAAPE